MAKLDIRKRIKSGLFLLDGAMGTQLFAHGIEIGKCNDYLNIESPAVISAIHQSYFKAGSDAVITNTFSANRYVLSRHNLAEEVENINKAAARIAREAAGQNGYVLGDIGPTGDFLEPLGMLKADELKNAFMAQAMALKDGGVDGFIIETMSAIDEICIAIEAAKAVEGLPVFASMSFDAAGNSFRTMMGVDVETAVTKMTNAGTDVVGFNCGKMSLDGYVKLAEQFVNVARKKGGNIIVFAEPNAGLPDLVDGKAVYKVTPEEFAQAAEKIHSLGINIIGGCCGTGPEHIKAIAKRLKKS